MNSGCGDFPNSLRNEEEEEEEEDMIRRRERESVSKSLCNYICLIGFIVASYAIRQ